MRNRGAYRAPRFYAQRAFVTAKVAVALSVVALILANALIWQAQILATSRRENLTRETAREQERLKSAVAAFARRTLLANEPSLFTDITSAALSQYLTADPRFSGRTAGAADTPGFSIAAIGPPGSPDFFSSTTAFETPRLGDPLDLLRQHVHPCIFSYTLRRRLVPTAPASDVAGVSGSFTLRLREVPLSSFSLVAWEDLAIPSSDGGWRFDGPSLVLGESIESGSTMPTTFAMRFSPWRIDDSQIGASEKVWDSSAISASLLAPPPAILDPNAGGPQNQNLAKRGQMLSFDGHALTSIGPLPPGIAVAASRGGVPRVVVNLTQLPLYNVPIDSGVPDAPGNRISAYHVQCMTALARDRGVVIVGASDPTVSRLCDIVTTNGSVILQGSHTAGPLIVGSSSGGVLFDTPGTSTWNAYIVATAPRGFVSGVSSSGAGGAPRTSEFPISSGSVALLPSEQMFDSVAISAASPVGSGLSFGFGGAIAGLPTAVLWVEAAAGANAARIGVRLPDGSPTYSDPLPIGTGPLTLTLSRSQCTAWLNSTAGVLTYVLPAGRTRIKTTAAVWSPTVTHVKISSSPSGTVLGSTGVGVLTLRGLYTLGSLTRVGEASFRFSPDAGGTPAERILPRLLMIVP